MSRTRSILNFQYFRAIIFAGIKFHNFRKITQKLGRPRTLILAKKRNFGRLQKIIPVFFLFRFFTFRYKHI